MLSFPTQKETIGGRNKSSTQNKAKTKNKGKMKAQKTEIARMVTAVHREYDHLLKSRYLIKKDDPSVVTILCSINRCYFYNTDCDTGTCINIMATVPINFYMVLCLWTPPMHNCRWWTVPFTSWKG